MRSVSAIVVTLATLLLLPFTVQAEVFQEGVDYEVLPQPGKVEVPGKHEVREFFWFGCPHCFALEEPLNKWRATLPSDVNFIRTPAPMNDNWVPHAHAFYVAESLGKLDEISTQLFNALHVKKEKVFTEDQLATFFTQFGVTETEFNKLYNSFAVRVKVRQAGALTKNYRLRGVPALVVDGKYLVKGRQGQPQESMFAIVQYLLDKERVGAATKTLQ